MKKTSNLDAFRSVASLVGELQKTKTPDSYWKAIDNELGLEAERARKVEQDTTMSSEKFHKCFSL